MQQHEQKDPVLESQQKLEGYGCLLNASSSPIRVCPRSDFGSRFLPLQIQGCNALSAFTCHILLTTQYALTLIHYDTPTSPAGLHRRLLRSSPPTRSNLCTDYRYHILMSRLPSLLMHEKLQFHPWCLRRALDPQSTPIQSYIIHDRPTYSQRHIPTLYTYESAACYRGEMKRSRTEIRSDTSCVNSGQFVAVAVKCNRARTWIGQVGWNDDVGKRIEATERRIKRKGAKIVVCLGLALMGLMFPGMVLRVPAATDLMEEGAFQQLFWELLPQPTTSMSTTATAPTTTLGFVAPGSRGSVLMKRESRAR